MKNRYPQLNAVMTTGGSILKMWDGFYHELHNEPECRQVLTAAVEWMDRHIPVLHAQHFNI